MSSLNKSNPIQYNSNHDSQEIEPLVWWKNAGKPWRLGESWTRESDRVENSEGKLYLLSEGHGRRLDVSSTDTPIKHVWDRVRKISGKNLCAPKQYLNGNNGTAITNPKDIANEHAAAFTDNSSSANYSAEFQTIKEQEEIVKIDFTSDNTEVYNKPFRLRDLRLTIMKNGFRFAAHKCKVIHFTAPRVRIQRPPTVRIGNTPLPVEESTKFFGLWWDSHLSFKKHISVLKAQCKEALNLIRVVAHLKWGGDRDTLLMLYQAIVRSKLDYGCIVYGTGSNANLRQLDSIHYSGLRLALGAFCTSPVSSLYTGTNEAPLEERRLKLSMHYYLKTRACINKPARYALHEFDQTTRDLNVPRPNGRGGMTRPPTHPISLKVEAAMASAEIDAKLVCPLRIPAFPPGTQLQPEETQPHQRSEQMHDL